MHGRSTELDTWLEEHGAKLVLYARQWVDCHADAEDVFHEAFLRFWRQRQSVREPQAYLYRCVRSAAIDWNRQRSRRKEQTLVAEPMLDAGSHQQDERIAELEAAVAELPIEQREVLVLKHWCGLTFEAIGEALDIPQRTAQSRHRYALEKLREILTEAETRSEK